MEWTKKGRIFNPQNSDSWISNYAALPVCDLIDDSILRIYFSDRDEQGRSVPTFIEVDPTKPEKIRNIHSEPILELGALGTFDDSGIMPSSIVDDGTRKLLYYIGWNPQVTVSYRLSIGLAVSYDGGITFEKISEGPVADRANSEPYFNTAPFVMKDEGQWKMWYVSCTGWEVINEWPEPYYNVKYAVSNDGISWKKTGITCIGYDDFTDAVGKPVVYKEDGIYKMFYSYRNAVNYREDPAKSYRLGYAESEDGVCWTRKDEQMGMSFSDSGWDSIMQEYCSTYVFQGKRYLVYNGNGFGETGFGYAILTQ
ncbi:hypothetical protein [Fodinibius saliphilus]|uniref:hypothetical protein n=1 Tax=Fodinibius saliphilus TaxID=1920650 RepID=UPI001107D897|nr:hypothetical protein [Fodinibius saliphilus]